VADRHHHDVNALGDDELSQNRANQGCGGLGQTKAPRVSAHYAWRHVSRANVPGALSQAHLIDAAREHIFRKWRRRGLAHGGKERQVQAESAASQQVRVGDERHRGHLHAHGDGASQRGAKTTAVGYGTRAMSRRGRGTAPGS
jgi:hypothetical protein